MIKRGFVVLALFALLGCSEKSVEKPPAIEFAGGGGEGTPYYSVAEGAIPAGEARKRAEAMPPPSSTDKAEPQKADVVRKIIQSATVHLVVEKFDDGEKQLRQVIEQHGGRVSSSDIQGAVGAQRHGRFKVRVPVDKFDAFKQAVEKIGNLERSSVESREVTEEYYDLQARLKNKTIEENRLIQHLEKSTGKLSDILDVERELSRVRGEIEQMKGRLNLLENLTSLTTVDIFLREVKNYTPPSAATFGDDVSRTLHYSSSMLINTGRVIALNAISILPWLPVWILLGLILYRPLRNAWRNMKASRQQAYKPTEVSG
jgi:hypothetical protein